jgi:hypothetical protein
MPEVTKIRQVAIMQHRIWTIIGVFVSFLRIFLRGILIFKGLTAQRLYKSFGVKGLITQQKRSIIQENILSERLCLVFHVSSPINYFEFPYALSAAISCVTI